MTRIAINVMGEGEPLVLLHGWGFDSQIWHSLAPWLSAYQIFMVDLPGFGASPWMDWDEFRQELEQNLPQRFVLVGWSMGGLFATRFAIEAGHRVKALINLASSPYFIREATWPGVPVELFHDFHQRFQDNPSMTRDLFIQTQVPGDVGSIPMRQVEPGAMAGLAAGLEILQSWDLRSALHGLHMPVSYIFGRLDTIVPRKLMPMMQSLYPQFNYTMIPKAAHMPFISHPQGCLDAWGIE